MYRFYTVGMMFRRLVYTKSIVAQSASKVPDIKNIKQFSSENEECTLTKQFTKIQIWQTWNTGSSLQTGTWRIQQD